MTTTPNAGSATGIDLAALEQLARAATPGPWTSDTIKSDGEYGTDEDGGVGFNAYVVADGKGRPLMDSLNRDDSSVHVDTDGEYRYAWDELARRDAEFVAAANPATVLALIALARATPQHPSAPAAAVRAAERIDAMHKGVVGVFAAIKAEHDAATPQHSVTEQAAAWANWKVGTDSYVPFTRREDAEASVRRSDIAATQEGPYEAVPLFHRRVAQPLTSTAATQPEQASIDWIYSVVRDVSELDRDSPEDEPDMLLVTGDELFGIIRRHAPARAALAIPASTAADQMLSVVDERDAGAAKAVYWFSILSKCARLLDLPDDEPIPSGVLRAVEALTASTAASEQAKDGELRTYRQALEIIGIRDCADPVAVAGAALVETGFWAGDTAASGQQAGAIERIADELDQEAQAYEGDFADVVRGCVESLRALSGRATIPSEADERADFEHAERASNLNRDDEGDYENPCVQSAWEGWKARAALTRRATTATPGYKLVHQAQVDGSNWIDIKAKDIDNWKSALFNVRTLYTAPAIATMAATDEHGLTVADWTRFHDAIADPDDTDHSDATTAADQQGVAQLPQSDPRSDPKSPQSEGAAQAQAGERLKAAILAALDSNETEMEGYSYFGSNPGVPKDCYDDVADEVIAAMAAPATSTEEAHVDPDPIEELVDTLDLDAQPELDVADVADSEGGHHD